MIENKYVACWNISNQCDREIIRICHEYELKHNISDTAFWILYTLHEADMEMTQTDICNSLYAPRQSANTAINKLAKDGIVKKIPVPSNQKSKYIVLTAKGLKLAEQIIVPMKKLEQDALSFFTDEEIENYLKIIQKRCELFRTLLGKEE